VNGDGSAVRDFVHVDDVASAFLLALENGCRPGKAPAYNVGATAASVAEILAVTGEVTGRPIPVLRNPPRNEPRVLIRVSSFCHLFERLSDYWTVARRTGKQG
jgi:UDP-glucose 4-epimerase